jgi:SAM-dependent methyltransferase
MSTQAQHKVEAPPDAFGFGRNWQRYLEEYLSPERERIAAESLDTLLEVDLRGKTFLDIGCGSGLFSRCAHNAGARSVVSLDVDPDSVAATKLLRERSSSPDTWTVLHGSILDDAVVSGLEPAQIVYSWGVLHHTGDMWQSIRNASSLVAPGGIFCIAIYNKVTGRIMDSKRWLRIKRAYNHSPRPVQLGMEWLYAGYFGLGQLRDRNNPFRIAREYKVSRGMALRTDLIDWLGGYPYEFATVEEVVTFCERECGLRKRKVVPNHPMATGNHEFVFERADAG